LISFLKSCIWSVKGRPGSSDVTHYAFPAVEAPPIPTGIITETEAVKNDPPALRVKRGALYQIIRSGLD
jgi:hypothetical protein